MTSATTDLSMDELRSEVDKRAFFGRARFALVLLAIAIYGVFSYYQLGIDKAAWRPDMASRLMLDLAAHKDHVRVAWKKPQEYVVSLEGNRKFIYETPPEWYSYDAVENSARITTESGGVITMFERGALIEWPGYDPIELRMSEDAGPLVVGYENRLDELPSWVDVNRTNIELKPELFTRFILRSSSAETYRYEWGWEHFWFDFNSPLRDYTIWQAIGLMFSGDRIDPAQSNASLVFTEFWENEIWFHNDIFAAMLETILMALLGTMLASLVALPLAFMAAKNVTPFAPLRFALRRLFDLLRGVDTLIWSIVFLRAFGPGVFTGIFAIAFTDTGTLGKLMSEAIENTDKKQREGVQSTGANAVQRNRFGVLPQIMPIFISQSLYYLESNTRSAVIIGALGAGGIGLKFIGAIQTGSDWEDVMYYSLLVLLTVILMDTMSAWLRRALIGVDRDARARRNDARRALFGIGRLPGANAAARNAG